MICKCCSLTYKGEGYWVCLTTPHDPVYTLCPDCKRGYTNIKEPLPIKNLVERFQKMKEEASEL